MAKSRKCYVLVNTKNGYICDRLYCNSIRSAKQMARESFGFAYRIFDDKTNKLIYQGYCN